VARKLSLNWGVIPLLYEGERKDDARIAFAVTRGRELGYVEKNDIVIATAGHQQMAGGTDMIRIIIIDR
jgi:pyruvate kinase